MIQPINGTDFSYSNPATFGAATTAASAQQSSTTAAQSSTADKVTLSATAQAYLLRSQGQSVADIAATLGTTSAVVDGYLDITSSSTTSSVAALPAAAQTTKAA